MEWVILILILLLQIWSIGLYYKWESYNKKKGENLAMKEDSRDINYEGEKGKNLATKEDIDEITKIIESVKNEISFENQRKHTFIEQRTNRFVNVLYLVELLQMYSNQLSCYLYDKHATEKLSKITNDINSTMLNLTHDIRLIKITIGKNGSITQQIDDILESSKEYTNFLVYIAKNAINSLTDWKIFFDLANEDKTNNILSVLASKSMNDLNSIRQTYNNTIKDKENKLYNDITEYLSVLKQLYDQDFYLKFDFVDIPEQKPEA